MAGTSHSCSAEIIWSINSQEGITDRQYGFNAPSIPLPSINTPFVTDGKGTLTLLQPLTNMHVGCGIETLRGTDFSLDFSCDKNNSLATNSTSVVSDSIWTATYGNKICNRKQNAFYFQVVHAICENVCTYSHIYKYEIQNALILVLILAETTKTFIYQMDNIFHGINNLLHWLWNN